MNASQTGQDKSSSPEHLSPVNGREEEKDKIDLWLENAIKKLSPDGQTSAGDREEEEGIDLDEIELFFARTTMIVCILGLILSKSPTGNAIFGMGLACSLLKIFSRKKE